MADTQMKLPDQAWFNQNVTDKTADVSAMLGYANAATLGYLPKILSSWQGIPEEAVYKMLEAGKAANPNAALLGSTLGYGADAVGAIAGGALAAGSAGAGSMAALASRYGLPVAKNLLKGGALIAAPATVASLVAPDYSQYDKADKQAAAAAAAPPPEPKEDPNVLRMSELTGLTPKQLRTIANRNGGGIPLDVYSNLAQARPATGKAGYKETAFSALMNMFENQYAEAAKSGDPAQLQAVDKNFQRMLSNVIAPNSLENLIVREQGE